MAELAQDLHDYIEALTIPTDIDAVRTHVPVVPIAATRRRRWLGVAAAAVLLVVIGGLLVLRERTDDQVQTVDSTRYGEDRFIIATDSDSRLVVFDAATGVALRILTGQQPGVSYDATAPIDSRHAFFIRHFGTCVAVLDRVDLRSGATTQLAGEIDGRVVSDPTVTADGKWLAYATGVCRPEQVPTLVVRDLGSGRQRSYPYLIGPFEYPAALTLAPDGRHLAFSHFDSDHASVEVVVLDLADATTAGEGHPLSSDGCPHQGSPAYRPDGTLLAVTCDDGDPSRVVVATFDPDTGRRLRTLFAIPDVHDVDEVTTLAVSHDGKSILFETPTGIYRRDGNGVARVPLPDGTYTPAWLADFEITDRAR